MAIDQRFMGPTGADTVDKVEGKEIRDRSGAIIVDRAGTNIKTR